MCVATSYVVAAFSFDCYSGVSASINTNRMFYFLGADLNKHNTARVVSRASSTVWHPRFHSTVPSFRSKCGGTSTLTLAPDHGINGAKHGGAKFFWPRGGIYGHFHFFRSAHLSSSLSLSRMVMTRSPVLSFKRNTRATTLQF